MKRIFIPLMAILLLVSCTPIDYPSSDYSSASIEEVKTKDPMWSVEKGSKNAIVSFSPLEGVDSYSIILSQEGGDTRSFSVLPSSFSLGRFHREIKGLLPDTNYILSLQVECGGEKGEVEESYAFKTEDSSSDKPEYAPYAFCEIRNETSATIHFNLEEGMWYRMVLYSEEDIGSKEFVFHSSGYSDSYDILGLEESKSYTLTIQHGKKNGEWGIVKREVEIDKYRVPATMKLSVDGNTFTLDTSPSGKEIYLLSRSDRSFSYKITAEEFVIPTSILPSMERDEYFAYNRTDNILSNAVSFTSPMKTEVTVTPDSITLEWEESEEALYFVSVKVINDNDKRVIPEPMVRDVESDGERAVLKLDKLVSNTNYEIEITFTLSDGASSTYKERVKTDSYVGTYAWLGYPSDGIRSAFWVDVKDSTDSAYPYYITVSEKDPAFDGNKYMIMPLIDDSLSSYVPIEGNIKYRDESEEFMKAYKWNAKKWNKTSMAPSEWKPQSTTINGDSVTSLVYSKAVGMNLYTKTQFSFRYREGKKELVFYNAGEGSSAGFVNIGLFTNPEPSPGLDKYSFVLTKIEGEV
ncbi:MAG: hypothetical protein MR687_03785 [Spirochaetales bacterium]|nr:hypothetical protein [Spirochaetales bacterium]